MRNAVSAQAFVQKNPAKKPAFILLYVDGDFPMATKTEEKEWQAFDLALDQQTIPSQRVTYQQILKLALKATSGHIVDSRAVKDLQSHILDKIDSV